MVPLEDLEPGRAVDGVRAVERVFVHHAELAVRGALHGAVRAADAGGEIRVRGAGQQQDQGQSRASSLTLSKEVRRRGRRCAARCPTAVRGPPNVQPAVPVRNRRAWQTGSMRLRERESSVSSLVAAGLLALLVMAALGVIVAGHNGAVVLDAPGSAIIELFAGHRTSAVVLAELGGPESIGLLVAALAVVLLVRGRRCAAALVVLAPATAGALTEFLLKPLVDRPLGTSLAFPSGHATATWALASAVVLLLAGSGLPRRVRLVDSAVAVGIAAVNSVALVGAQYHLFTDVVGGAGVGIGVSCLVAAGLGIDPRTPSARSR